ncbi:hypothetical protein [Bordetella petrii]|uniref:Uncharacterized protein n=1 Tax=Bordetella petrii (strain ATCC BAA-461 / DSM 12804 / CCUG 43448 / CIP 107267 / Se-1111R) TaxID=340100 RepID=A9I958_BORPD|nr:hypothetical protein [Bordetella petrii]CAP41331.1 hypothetical protein predicted by Glimmer/Critica [Bordetella petrii]
MKRAILRLPAGTRFDSLTAEQQAAISSVFAQFVLPMPGTTVADGYELVDGLAGDNFDPAVMPGLGMDWPIVALCQWDEAAGLATIQPLDEAVLLAHLAPVVELDADGNVVGSQPAELDMPHNWAGWPWVDFSVPTN